MAKDRPWHRTPEPQPERTLEPEHLPEPHRMVRLELLDMTDEEVRAYCLQWSRYYLLRHEMASRLNSEHLEDAARFAQIAQAFRPDPQ
ncbi:hypothetical protein [Streptomyces sp. NPDC055058]